jgi:hypothetical protein
MHGLVKRFWMHALGACVIIAAVTYWFRLQVTPRYVALQGANALYGGGSPSGLEFHPDELKELGLSQSEAAEVLERIRTAYLPQVRIVSEPEFREQPGKDLLSFEVEVAPGVRGAAVVEVISENGRGLLMFGDLVASYRACLYRLDVEGAARERNFEALNGIREMLLSSGVHGYWDITRNRYEKWPEYTRQGEQVAVASL